MRRAPFVAATAGLALVISVLIGWLTSAAGVDVQWWITIPTALFVGTFVAFLIQGPGDRPAKAEGFKVVSEAKREDPEPVVQPKWVAPGEEPPADLPPPVPSHRAGEPPSEAPPRRMDRDDSDNRSS